MPVNGNLMVIKIGTEKKYGSYMSDHLQSGNTCDDGGGSVVELNIDNEKRNNLKKKTY